MLSWDQVAISDVFRSATPFQKSQIRNAWLSREAPQLYPQMLKDPRIAAQVRQSTFFQIPDKLPDEDFIIAPKSLSMDGINTLERNPVFAKKSFNEQMQYKQIWFAKMAATDSEYKSLAPQQQQLFFQNFMNRAPAIPGNPIFDASYDKEQTMRDFVSNPKWMQQSASYFTQFTRAIGSGAWSLIVGPTRWLIDKIVGKDQNLLGTCIDISDKMEDWRQYVADANNPAISLGVNLAGNVLGMVSGLGPYAAMEKALAGTFMGATATGKLIAQPGLLATAGKFLGGTKVPQFVYQTLGGVTAGAIQGVSQAMAEGKPWNTYLGRDIAMGVVLEPIQRYLGGIKLIRNVMKQAGIKGKVSTFMAAPFTSDIAPDFAAILKADPTFNKLMDIKQTVDRNGFIVENYTTKPVIDLRANMLGLNVQYESNAAKVMKGEKELFSVKGTPDVTLQRVSDFIDLQELPISKKASIEEQVATAPRIEFREGVIVPQQIRTKILDTFQEHGLTIAGSDTSPNGENLIIDRIYSILKTRSPNRAMTALASMGYNLGAGEATLTEQIRTGKAAIKQLKAEIEMLYPGGAYFHYDTRTGKILPSDAVPSFFVEGDQIIDPTVIQKTAVMNPLQLRDTLNQLKKVYINEKTATTRIFKGKQVELTRYNDTRLVQLKIDVPNESGILHPVTLSFDSVASANKFMKGGTDAAIERVFKENPTLQKSMADFKASLSKTDFKKYRNDFLPFQYLAKQALDQEYYLGHWKGKYIIEDKLVAENRFYQFDNLQEVGGFLQSHDRLRGIDDILSVSPEVFEELYPEGKVIDPLTRPDPLQELEELKIAQKKWGVWQALTMNIKPTQYVFEMFEKSPIGARLRKAGMGPVEIHNVFRKGVEAANNWARTHINYNNSLSKGFNEEMADIGRRWIISLDDISEEIPGHTYELKANVEQEMVDRFGEAKANLIKDRAVKIHRVLEDLFVQAKVNPALYLKHYMSRIRSAMNKVKVSQHVDIRKAIIGLPDIDKPAYFELMREADPKAIALENNMFRLANSYVNAAARRKYLSPILTEIATIIKKTKPFEGISDADHVAFIHYMQDIFRDVSGGHTPGELTMKLAFEATMENIAEKFKIPFKKNSADIIQKLVTNATGAYLSFRPWAVGKQLTQSLITGAPLIKIRWWAEGFNKVMEPGSLQRLISLGVIDPGIIPTGSGFALSQEGVIAKGIRKGMEAYQWGDWINRAIVYYGAQARFRTAANAYLNGKMNKAQFIKQSGMKLFGKAEENYIRKLLRVNDLPTGLRAAEDQVARLASNRSQYLYDKFEQPSLFRRGIGKLVGQFTSWPINFAAYVMEGVKNLPAVDKARFIVELGALTTATAVGFAQAGIRSEEFLPWNMVMFQGGPYYQMLNDFGAALNGDKQRWSRAVRALTGLVPFSRAGESVFQAIDAFNRGEMYEGFLRLMSAPPILHNMEPAETPLDAMENSLIEAGNKFLTWKDVSEKKFLGIPTTQ